MSAGRGIGRAAGLALGVAVVGTWAGLALARKGFWRASERDNDAPSQKLPAPQAWPAVTAVIPARDEAEGIAQVLNSLLAQDYPGAFRIILVDDASSDGTGAIARALDDPQGRLTIIDGTPLPPGWTGKLWAVHQGIEAAGDGAPYLWLTDADIVHAPDTLRSLITRVTGDSRVLVSLMAELRTDSAAERALIPAFVWFFQMLYPFAEVNRRGHGRGAAAGGCMLVDAGALRRAGGIAALKGALIDDCALGAMMKRQGDIWLGLTHRSRSIRVAEDWRPVATMISRSAYAQLGYSPLALVGTVGGMAALYGAPVGMTLFGRGGMRLAGAASWAIMAALFQPMLRFYRRSPAWGLALPGIAVFYTGCTLASAWDYHRGRGGQWKGRVQAHVGAAGTLEAADDGKGDGDEVARLASGKGHRDENFPVASLLLRAEARPPVMAFYRFARAADDVADTVAVPSARRLALLSRMRDTLTGALPAGEDGEPLSRHLAGVMAARGLDPVHALDLLTAFERDCTTTRTPDWDALIDYCRYSAMPVGRFVLDVHSEDRALWPASDALCTALQIINHVQDCAKDYRQLDRVYLPDDLMAAAGADVTDLSRPAAPPALRAVIVDLAERTEALLDQSADFAAAIRDRRLAMEVAVIHRLAVSLNRRLKTRDPLSARVHHGKGEAMALAMVAAASQLVRRRT